MRGKGEMAAPLQGPALVTGDSRPRFVLLQANALANDTCRFEIGKSCPRYHEERAVGRSTLSSTKRREAPRSCAGRPTLASGYNRTRGLDAGIFGCAAFRFCDAPFDILRLPIDRDPPACRAPGPAPEEYQVPVLELPSAFPAPALPRPVRQARAIVRAPDPATWTSCVRQLSPPH